MLKAGFSEQHWLELELVVVGGASHCSGEAPSFAITPTVPSHAIIGPGCAGARRTSAVTRGWPRDQVRRRAWTDGLQLDVSKWSLLIFHLGFA